MQVELDVRAMVCTRCSSEVKQSEELPCPDCGARMEWMLGECGDCGAITDSPEVTGCGPCVAYGNYIDAAEEF